MTIILMIFMYDSQSFLRTKEHILRISNKEMPSRLTKQIKLTSVCFSLVTFK